MTSIGLNCNKTKVAKIKVDKGNKVKLLSDTERTKSIDRLRKH